MTDDKKTAHKETELLAIFEENKFDKRYLSNFLAYYNLCFGELYHDMKDDSDEYLEPGYTIQASALSISLEYMNTFIDLINKGHGEKWAHEMAHTCEDVERGAYHTYFDMKANDPEQAEKELVIYCKGLGGDELFEKYFLYLFREMEDPDCIFAKATTYSETYRKLIKNGKTEIYAQQYADLQAEDYHRIYCEDYAYSYEKALINNKSIEYAKLYAEEYASALVDIKRRHGISEDEDMINFAIEKVNAYMISWEYARDHELSDRKSFMSLYERIHLDTYYADEPLPVRMKEEEINKMIMEKVLAEYERRGGK
ncbi:MAG: hypothetical protein WCJ03_06525 [Bacteroidales bacterium]